MRRVGALLVYLARSDEKSAGTSATCHVCQGVAGANPEAISLNFSLVPGVGDGVKRGQWLVTRE